MRKEVEKNSLSLGSIVIIRPSVEELQVEIPTATESLDRVVVNGRVFQRDGSINQVVRVAPEKFTKGHFEQVDDRVQHGYSVTGACKDVAAENGFEPESFRQQYYRRHASRKRLSL